MSLFYKTLSLEGLIKKMPENKVFNNYPNTFSFKKNKLGIPQRPGILLSKLFHLKGIYIYICF